MANKQRRERIIIDKDTRPQLVSYVKLRHDVGRDRWVLLAPERVLTPNDVAIEVLKLCDGVRSVEDVSGVLAQEYDAPPDAILADIIPLLQQLADDRYLRT